MLMLLCNVGFLFVFWGFFLNQLLFFSSFYIMLY